MSLGYIAEKRNWNKATLNYKLRNLIKVEATASKKYSRLAEGPGVLLVNRTGPMKFSRRCLACSSIVACCLFFAFMAQEEADKLDVLLPTFFPVTMKATILTDPGYEQMHLLH